MWNHIKSIFFYETSLSSFSFSVYFIFFLGWFTFLHEILKNSGFAEIWSGFALEPRLLGPKTIDYSNVQIFVANVFKLNIATGNTKNIKIF